MALADLPAWFITITAVLLGLNCGSFLNVVIYRLPRGMSLAMPGSHCTSCEKPIKPYDNVPVLAWLWLRGRSRCCQEKISVRYPAVEAIGGLMAWAIVVTRLEPHAEQLPIGEAVLLFVLYLGITLSLLAAALIDLEHMILPHSLTWGGAVLGLLSSPFRPEVDPTSAFLGAVLGYAAIWIPFIWLHKLIRGFEGMGRGDADLMVLAGTWLGPWGVLLTLLAGSLQGTIIAGISLLVRGKIEDPEAVVKQREELKAALEQATGKEREALQREYDDDLLAKDPEERQGGPVIAFGPFLALAIIEQILFHDLVQVWLQTYFYL